MKSLALAKTMTVLPKEKRVPKNPPKPKKVEAPSDTPLAEGLAAALDESIGSQIEGRFKERKGFVPSETNQCARYLTYLLRGIYVPATHNSRTQRIFDNGHGFHERIGKYFEDMGILKGTEIPINSGLDVPVPIYGFADGVIDWGGQDMVVEFKSINDAGYMAISKMKKPKDDHYRQVQLYMAAMDLQTSMVIYENKNDQAITIFEVKRNQEYLDKLFKKYVKTYTAFLNGEPLPDRPSKSPTSDICKWCNLNEFCWNDSEGVIIKITKKEEPF